MIKITYNLKVKNSSSERLNTEDGREQIILSPLFSTYTMCQHQGGTSIGEIQCSPCQHRHCGRLHAPER